jgi:hypothetical protein
MDRYALSDMTTEGTTLRSGTAGGEVIQSAAKSRKLKQLGASALFALTVMAAGFPQEAQAMGMMAQATQQNQQAAEASQGKSFGDSWGALKSAASKAGGVVKDKVEGGVDAAKDVAADLADGKPSMETGKTVGKAAVGAFLGLPATAAMFVADKFSNDEPQPGSNDVEVVDLSAKLDKVRADKKAKSEITTP